MASSAKLGRDHYLAGSYDLAAEEFTKALIHNATDARLFICRASAYTKSGNNKGALQDLRQAIHLDGTAVKPYLQSASIFQKQKKSRQAVQILTYGLGRLPVNERPPVERMLRSLKDTTSSSSAIMEGLAALLPWELLTCVLQFTDTGTMFKCMLVCRHWRDCIMSTSSLWSTISLDVVLNKKSGNALEKLSYWIARSRGRLTSVSVNSLGKASSERTFDEYRIASMLVDHRVQTLRELLLPKCPYAIDNFTPVLRMNQRSLTKIKVDLPTGFRLNYFLRLFPNLKTLNVCGTDHSMTSEENLFDKLKPDLGDGNDINFTHGLEKLIWKTRHRDDMHMLCLPNLESLTLIDANDPWDQLINAALHYPELSSETFRNDAAMTRGKLEFPKLKNFSAIRRMDAHQRDLRDIDQVEFPQLESINMESFYPSSISPSFFESLVSKSMWRNLTSMTLLSVTINEECFKMLGEKCPELRLFRLYSSNCSPKALLTALQRWKNLVELEIEHVPMEDAVVKTIDDNLFHLEKLSISQCPVSEAPIVHLVKTRLPYGIGLSESDSSVGVAKSRIISLDITENGSVTPPTIEWLKAVVPEFRHSYPQITGSRRSIA